MVANQEITDQFIHNLKSNPNKFHDLTGEMKRSLKKERLEETRKLQIQKITRITENNGKTDYHGSTYANHLAACNHSTFTMNERKRLLLTTDDIF